MKHAIIPAALLLLLSACGGASTSEQAALPTKPWKDQDHDERLITMKKRVWPAMKAEFAAFDPKAYEAITCETCHGAGAKDHSFKMPNPKLPKLPATPEGFEKLKKEHADIMRFMMETVVPRMADFVGEKPYNPKTHEGFGCFRCHTKDPKAGS